MQTEISIFKGNEKLGIQKLLMYNLHKPSSTSNKIVYKKIFSVIFLFLSAADWKNTAHFWTIYKSHKHKMNFEHSFFVGFFMFTFFLSSDWIVDQLLWFIHGWFTTCWRVILFELVLLKSALMRWKHSLLILGLITLQMSVCRISLSFWKARKGLQSIEIFWNEKKRSFFCKNV